ncbi:FMN-linked oxidoreductase [Coniophora puteana RWD-64-598 SS2]|uniref:tRNA-dihydrouridine synthase n=1 Tax=Coniophora puteana (strain RWD-64-598) TaxID=741705 RepID=A0A5M3MGV0_CONPW|nr:FMN-linked oxidoreductase [Coniophora puteana RWD-64-598 SS2]EIW78459.1 FMN-linked oxidoreductase [Coniophora puteana RWD-64-598 SS2]
MVEVEDLRYIAAPMVNQSDFPFRQLTRRYGATLAYTQMLAPERLINDQDYLETHLRDLWEKHVQEEARSHMHASHRVCAQTTRNAPPVVVQLCGNDPETIVRAARTVQQHCDGIDLNLGCPQEHAREGHYGGYLLGRKDWPLVQSIVPVSTKIRLCQHAPDTLPLGTLLEASGTSWVTLHARHVSARRRRQGVADLQVVKELKDSLRIPVISNGNVRTWNDLQDNRTYTSADGCMVGETLLGNPCIFANIVPDPVQISLEYLELCREHQGCATIHDVRAHVRRFVEHQCSRKPWYAKFRVAINQTESIEDIESLLLTKVNRWRGKARRIKSTNDNSSEDTEQKEHLDPKGRLDDELTGLSLLG